MTSVAGAVAASGSEGMCPAYICRGRRGSCCRPGTFATYNDAAEGTGNILDICCWSGRCDGWKNCGLTYVYLSVLLEIEGGKIMKEVKCIGALGR